MKCPQCQSDAPDSADHCFNCGHVFRPAVSLIRGSMVAGRYEIEAPLGKGGMGIVYRAKDHKLDGETIAIKILLPGTAADEDKERRFRTEIRLARKVRHRHVCGIHEYGEDGALRYIAMELIEGVDLRKVLHESGPFPPERAFETSIHVAEGLQAIHDAGIVHRDLKTANLMRDASGVVRLMDFGIAKQLGDGAAGATATGLVVGTPEYMSPEQARGEKVDGRSDIYALGIVTFELFTGRVPFRGDTPIATIYKHLQEPPPLEGPEGARLPPAVIPVLRCALAKKREDRFATASEFAAAMAQAQSDAAASPTLLASSPTLADPAGTAPTSVLEPGPGETRRWPVVPLTIAAALVLAIGTALFLYVRGSGRAPAAAVSSSLPTPSPEATPEPGVLVIDALPWGEVVDVVGANGKSRALGGARYTPVSLLLPPGEYTVRVRNPAFPESLSTRATIGPSTSETRVVEFRRIDPEDYFRRTGF